MYRLINVVVLLPMLAMAVVGNDAAIAADACTDGQMEMAVKAKEFQGEPRIKQLIDADLKRARREQAEGDTDECLEALEHAGKLIKGDY
jgi:hypothetical protein